MERIRPIDPPTTLSFVCGLLGVVVLFAFARAACAETPEETFLRLMAEGPCPTAPRELCDERLVEWREAGDPLARWLLQQYEDSVRLDVPGAVRYVRYAAFTAAPVVKDFLIAKLDSASDPKRARELLEGMARFPSDRQIRDAAIRAFDRFSNDEEVQIRCVNAVSWNVQGRQGAASPAGFERVAEKRSQDDADALAWLDRVSRSTTVPDRVRARARAERERTQ